eukprot:m.103677 g.103677  ORF g.103677 m.103677 type:complete len:141 (+) comp12620_c2_seq1:874-1296(+)
MSNHFPKLQPSAEAPKVTKASTDGKTGFDTLRLGLGKQHGPTIKHPLEEAQKKRIQHHENLKLSIMGAIQGRAAPQLVRLERSLLAQNRRLPVLHSPMLGLEISLGLLDTIDFEDYLNDPRDADEMGNVHTMTEKSAMFN